MSTLSFINHTDIQSASAWNLMWSVLEGRAILLDKRRNRSPAMTNKFPPYVILQNGVWSGSVLGHKTTVRKLYMLGTARSLTGVVAAKAFSEDSLHLIIMKTLSLTIIMSWNFGKLFFPQYNPFSIYYQGSGTLQSQSPKIRVSCEPKNHNLSFPTFYLFPRQRGEAPSAPLY